MALMPLLGELQLAVCKRLHPISTFKGQLVGVNSLTKIEFVRKMPDIDDD